MSTYLVPENYYYRLHHIRPRFKGDIENVLIYVATEISKLGVLKEQDFRKDLNYALREFPGNQLKTQKTIDNWRTEISSLFGFIRTSDSKSKPGKRALELAEEQDLIQSFKIFLFNFQYPGGHTKPHETKSMIEAGIKFKPAKYILGLLEYAESAEGARIGLNSEELTHCILNDLRCTRDNQEYSKTWNLIKTNRDANIQYNTAGDIVRYAGDILDYLVIANLLVTYDNQYYYLNKMEEGTIKAFIDSEEWFSGYDELSANNHLTVQNVSKLREEWFGYVNRDMEITDFKTDVYALIAENEEEYLELRKMSLGMMKDSLEDSDTMSTAEIGDYGESLVLHHECLKLQEQGRDDLVHLVKRIPSQFAAGYDISSVDAHENKRYIEVKTTVSQKPLSFKRFSLTPNEWRVAESLEHNYYVYRLLISKVEQKLFIIQDPIKQYKKDNLKITPSSDLNITIVSDSSGEFEELLSWEK